jgi:hypothetical protein
METQQLFDYSITKFDCRGKIIATNRINLSESELIEMVNTLLGNDPLQTMIQDFKYTLYTNTKEESVFIIKLLN